MRVPVLTFLCVALAAGCAYRRHETLLQPVHAETVDATKAPRQLHRLTLISAELPQRKISGLAWDEDGSGPDPFVRVYVDGRRVFQSEVVKDQHRPRFGVTLEKNVALYPASRLRIELWDHDTAVSADPIGHIETIGLPPTALPGAQARLSLNSGTMLTLQADPPSAHQGVGLTVEVRPDYLKVLRVEPYSPAGRAGIRAGEHIVGIGPERISHLSDDEAISQLSLAADRQHKLMVTREDGTEERAVALDGNLVWLVL